MNVIVFEDHKALNLEPISLTRAGFDIRCGAKTFIERLKELDSIDIYLLNLLFIPRFLFADLEQKTIW